MQIVTLEEIQKKFDGLPEDLKWAIMAANVDDKIIDIGQKHGLLVPQMEQLSLETHAVMFGYTHPDKFEESLKGSMQLPELKIKELVEDINENILQSIRDKFMSLYDKPRETFKITKPAEPNVVGIETHISSPNVINIKPIKNEELRITNDKSSKDIPTLSSNTTIEIMPEELVGKVQLPITNYELGIKDKEIIKEKPIEKIEEIIPVKPIQKIEKIIPMNMPTNNKVEANTTPNTIPTNMANSISSQKLSGSFQLPTIKTEYSLPSVGKDKITPSISRNTTGSSDPYREIPE
ncbi:MAG: hypothetical protein WCI93_00925 [bacterium]